MLQLHHIEKHPSQCFHSEIHSAISVHGYSQLERTIAIDNTKENGFWGKKKFTLFSIRSRWKTADIESTAKLPTKIDAWNTHEYMLDNTHWSRSGEQPALDFRRFPMYESLILNYT